MLCCVPSCFSHVWLFATLWTVAHQTPLSMGFSREEYWSRCHALPQGIFPIQESNPQLLCLLYRQASSLALVLPGLNMSPQIYVYLEPVDVILLKNRVFADIIKLNPTGLGWGWENKFSVISVPIRREKVGPGRTPSEGLAGQAWGDVSTSQRMPRIASQRQKIERNKKDSSLEPSEVAWPCQHLKFRLLVAKLWDNTFLLFLSHLVCGNIHGNLRMLLMMLLIA